MKRVPSRWCPWGNVFSGPLPWGVQEKTRSVCSHFQRANSTMMSFTEVWNDVICCVNLPVQTLCVKTQLSHYLLKVEFKNSNKWKSCRHSNGPVLLFVFPFVPQRIQGCKITAYFIISCDGNNEQTANPSHWKQHKEMKHSFPAESFQLHKIMGSASVDKYVKG